jgi:CBS domain-containing protein
MMSVQNILRGKGGAVFTISADASLSDALGELAERNVGALVVHTDANPAAGILSERDIVRRLAREGESALAVSVRNCMTPGPRTCTPETSVEEVMSIMTDMRIRHMPVMENRRLVGVISIGDVVKSRIEHAEREAAELRDYIAS